MPAAARVTDPTNQGGQIIGPGASSVTIGGLVASVLGDSATCPLPQLPPVSDFVTGSSTVFIEGKPAVRIGDKSSSGGEAIVGESTVLIG